MVESKQEFLRRMRESPYYLKEKTAKCDVERYSDKYKKRVVEPWTPRKIVFGCSFSVFFVSDITKLVKCQCTKIFIPLILFQIGNVCRRFYGREACLIPLENRRKGLKLILKMIRN